MRELAVYYVYILQSVSTCNQTYVGFSTNLKSRLQSHNSGGCPHTAKFKPWRLIWYCAFFEKTQALAFEKYLKSHSGKAFASKRLINQSSP
jgi:predicted GIY-YIG superfamily endonuclease